jgi:hypothetical protein
MASLSQTEGPRKRSARGTHGGRKEGRLPGPRSLVRAGAGRRRRRWLCRRESRSIERSSSPAPAASPSSSSGRSQPARRCLFTPRPRARTVSAAKKKRLPPAGRSGAAPAPRAACELVRSIAVREGLPPPTQESLESETKKSGTRRYAPKEVSAGGSAQAGGQTKRRGHEEHPSRRR